MSQRILVTGSTGFLGRHLCQMIGARGDTPIGLDLETNPDAPFLQVVGSVNDPAAWKTVGAVDAVIHAAALTDLWRPNPEEFDHVNRAGSVMAAQFAHKLDLRMVLVSSYTVLMPTGREDERPLTGREASEPNDLIGPYAHSKRMAELEVREVHSNSVVVRPTAPIGPGDHRPTPPMRLVRDVVAGKLPGVMQGRINVIDVRDVAAGVLAALDKTQAEGPYLLSGHDLSLKAFAASVAEAAGVKPPALEVPVGLAKVAAHVDEGLAKLRSRPVMAPLDGVRLAAQPVSFDATYAEKDLGFKARPLDETIKDAVAFARQEWV